MGASGDAPRGAAGLWIAPLRVEPVTMTATWRRAPRTLPIPMSGTDPELLGRH